MKKVLTKEDLRQMIRQEMHRIKNTSFSDVEDEDSLSENCDPLIEDKIVKITTLPSNLFTKDKYNKGDVIYFQVKEPDGNGIVKKIIYKGVVENVTKDWTSKFVYIINSQGIRHWQILGSEK